MKNAIRYEMKIFPGGKKVTVELQYNGHPPSAAKMPVYWSLPLFMDPFSYFIIKMVSSKNDGILDFAAILGRR